MKICNIQELICHKKKIYYTVLYESVSFKIDHYVILTLTW